MTNAVSYLKKHPETLWLLAILALATALRLCFLHEPFERDEGQYATIAQEILRGGVPYRDAIEIKPPGVFYLYAIAIGLLGPTTEAVRIFTAGYALLTVLAVYAVARRLAGTRAGLQAALVYALFSSFPRLQGSGCNSEVFLVLPLTAGVLFLMKALESRDRSHLFSSGLCAGFALLIKPVALPVVALELLFIPFLRRVPKRPGKWLPDLAAFLIPMLALALITFGYFALRGALGDLVYWTIDFPRSYKGSSVTGPPLPQALLVVGSALAFPLLAGLPAALWFAWSRRSAQALLLLLLLPAAWLAVALPGKYFPHYFITLLPFLAISSGVGLDALGRLTPTLKVAAGLVLLAVLASSVRDSYRFYTEYTPPVVSIYKYNDTIFAESTNVAAYLKEHTRHDDYIFQWGFEPELYFLTDRRFPSRYLVSILPGWSGDPEKAIGEMMRSLAEHKPAYIVVQNKFIDFPGVDEVAQYIQQNCSEESNIEYARIYRCATGEDRPSATEEAARR